MITPSYSATATERVLPRLALDFTTASLDARVTVTRSLNTATRTNASGILEIVNANLPRFDYDPSTLVCKGLLIEEARTNLLLNSLINGTILSTQAVAVTAVVYTISFYGTGTITLSGAHVAVVTGSGAYPSRKTYTFTPTAGALTVTVTGTVQFAQLEAGTFATSYIPTTTTSVTRNADVVTMTGTNFSSWFNSAQGTFDAQFTFAGLSALTGGVPFAMDDGTANGYMIYRNLDGSGLFVFAGSNVVNILAPSNNTPYNICSSYNSSSSGVAAANGNATSSLTTTGVSTPTQAWIGRNWFGNQFTGWVRKINYWDLLVTPSEVRAFSK